MRHARIRMAIALALALTGCSALKGGGTVRPSALQASVRAPCPRPESLVDHGGTTSADERSLGRIGDALIACSAKHQAAVLAYDELAGIIAGQQ